MTGMRFMSFTLAANGREVWINADRIMGFEPAERSPAATKLLLDGLDPMTVKGSPAELALRLETVFDAEVNAVRPT